MKITTTQLKKLIKETLESSDNSKPIKLNIVVEIDAEDYLNEFSDGVDGRSTATYALRRRMISEGHLSAIEDMLSPDFSNIMGTPIAIRSVKLADE